MADIDLEAEQVVGEEEETAPSKKGRKLPSKGVLIFAGVALVQAVILFAVFNVIQTPSDAGATTVDDTEPQSLEESYAGRDMLVIEGISVFDGNQLGERTDRRFTFTVGIWIEKKKYEELTTLSEAREGVLELVKADFKQKVIDFLTQQGAAVLTNSDKHELVRKLLADDLNQKMSAFRGSIQEVFFLDFMAHRF